MLLSARDIIVFSTRQRWQVRVSLEYCNVLYVLTTVLLYLCCTVLYVYTVMYCTSVSMMYCIPWAVLYCTRNHRPDRSLDRRSPSPSPPRPSGASAARDTRSYPAIQRIDNDIFVRVSIRQSVHHLSIICPSSVHHLSIIWLVCMFLFSHLKVDLWVWLRHWEPVPAGWAQVDRPYCPASLPCRGTWLRAGPGRQQPVAGGLGKEGRGWGRCRHRH